MALRWGWSLSRNEYRFCRDGLSHDTGRYGEVWGGSLARNEEEGIGLSGGIGDGFDFAQVDICYLPFVLLYSRYV